MNARGDGRRTAPAIIILAIAAVLATAPVTLAANASGIDVRLPAGHTITGTITRQSDGAVVNGAYVSAYGAAGYSYAQTNSTGKYTLKALPSGSYTMYVSTPDSKHLQDGYWTTANGNHFTTNPAAATQLTITTSNLTGKNMKLPADPTTYSISGKITRKSDGAGVNNVEVTASGATGSRSDLTSATGAFKVIGLLPGSYKLTIEVPGDVNLQSGCYKSSVASHFTANCNQATTLTITTSNLTGKNAALPNGLKITGTVNTRAGAAVAFAGVEAMSQGSQFDRSASTSATGAFSIVGLSPGTFVVKVTPPFDSELLDGYYSSANSYHWVAGAGSATNVSLSANTSLGTIKPKAGFTISGKLMGPGAVALQYGSVSAFGTAGYGFASTAADGTFTIVGLPAGQYTVGVDAPYFDPTLQSGWYRSGVAGNFTADQSTATSVTLGPNKTGVNVTLPVGYEIAGMITKSGGTAIPYASVVAHRSNGQAYFSYTDGSGNYLFQGLPADGYTVQVGSVIEMNLLGGWYRAGASGNYTASQAQATTVTIGP